MDKKTKPRRRTVFITCTDEEYTELRVEALRRKQSLGAFVLEMLRKALEAEQKAA